MNWAKLQIWVTTWVAWYGGIVLLNSDLAFTALNVLSHGVPYLAVVWAVEGRRWEGELARGVGVSASTVGRARGGRGIGAYGG